MLAIGTVVNLWFRRDGRWVQISRESISSQSFFLLKKAKHGVSSIISVRLPRVNNWYSGKVPSLEGMAVEFKYRARQFHQSHFLS